MMIWEISKAGHLAQNQTQLNLVKTPCLCAVLIQIHCMNDDPSFAFSPPEHQKTSAEMKGRYVFAKPAHVRKKRIEGFLLVFES